MGWHGAYEVVPGFGKTSFRARRRGQFVRGPARCAQGHSLRSPGRGGPHIGAGGIAPGTVHRRPARRWLHPDPRFARRARLHARFALAPDGLALPPTLGGIEEGGRGHQRRRSRQLPPGQNDRTGQIEICAGLAEICRAHRAIVEGCLGGGPGRLPARPRNHGWKNSFTPSGPQTAASIASLDRGREGVSRLKPTL